MQGSCPIYQVLPLHACMSMFSASFPASRFDVTLTGMPNFESKIRFDLHPRFAAVDHDYKSEIF